MENWRQCYQRNTRKNLKLGIQNWNFCSVRPLESISRFLKDQETTLKNLDIVKYFGVGRTLIQRKEGQSDTHQQLPWWFDQDQSLRDQHAPVFCPRKIFHVQCLTAAGTWGSVIRLFQRFCKRMKLWMNESGVMFYRISHIFAECFLSFTPDETFFSRFSVKLVEWLCLYDACACCCNLWLFALPLLPRKSSSKAFLRNTKINYNLLLKPN